MKCYGTPTHPPMEDSRAREGRRQKQQQKTGKKGDLGGIWWFDGMSKE